MPAEAPLLILTVAIVVLAILAVLLVAALMGRGPLFGRFVEPRPIQPPAAPPAAALAGDAARSNVRLVPRQHRSETLKQAAAHRAKRPQTDELGEILEGSMAGEAYNRTVRILAWAFILAVVLIVSVTNLWQPVRDEILVTLTLGGIFVLVVHELMPPRGLGPIRFVLEGSAAIIFLTMLVVLTGRASSPFFFIYPLLVGFTALIASPAITLVLTFEAAGAYTIAAVGGPFGGDTSQGAMASVGINLTTLVLLAFAGMVISRAQRRTRDAAIRLSTVDSLTDLYNRAYYFSAIDREIQRSRRFRRGFCLLMMDLDGLKTINDRFGHYHGDLILRGVAGVIRTGLRSIDVAARYGGDEFVALLPETDPSGAYVVAEKIRLGVTELVIEAGGQQITTSLSIGVVSYPEDGQTADELMIAADEAMYSSKRLGKNRVVGFAEPSEATVTVPPVYRAPAATPGFRPLPREGDERAGADRAEGGPDIDRGGGS